MKVTIKYVDKLCDKKLLYKLLAEVILANKDNSNLDVEETNGDKEKDDRTIES